MRSTWKWVLLFVMFSWGFPSHAVDEAGEADRRIKAAQTMGALGPNLFGDTTNFYNGDTSFSTTDIDLPGNNSLPVRAARMTAVSKQDNTGGWLGNWELDIPYMDGIFAASTGWQVSGSAPNNRCSSAGLPPTVNSSLGTTGTWVATKYWRGNTLHIPGAGTQTLLFNGTLPTPADGQVSHMSTSQGWQIRCLASLANPGSSPGFSGEGFLVLSPDGTQYFLNWMNSRVTELAARNSPKLPNGTSTVQQLQRVEVRLYPTKVMDRFGNTVTYAYTGNQLNSITANDGRQITFTYGSNGRIDTASANGRTWRYTYTTNYLNNCTPNASYACSTAFLTQVQLPDLTSWLYNNLTGYSISYDTNPNTGTHPCYLPGKWLPANQDKTVVVTHPSGAVGTFLFSLTRHGRSLVENDCLQNNADPSQPSANFLSQPPIATDNLALVSKIVSGPGLTTAQWTNSYPLTAGSTADIGGGSNTTTVIMTNPDQTAMRLTFGIQFHVTEGLMLQADVLSSSGAVQRSTVMAYATSPSNPPYPYAPGDSGVGNNEDFAATHLIPRTSTTTTVNGDTFVNRVNSFDGFAREVSVSRYNSFGGSRTDQTTYYDDSTHWVLGQMKAVTNADTGQVMASMDYDATTAKPIRMYTFGLLQASLGYNPDGTLQTMANGLGITTTLSNWKRGAPQTILFPEQTTRTAVIDDYGLVSSVTDERGSTTSYGYDVLGRIASITYPAGDSVAWAGQTISFTQLTTSELGQPAGTWRMRLNEANHQKSVYLDARYNPVLDQDLDQSSGIARYTSRRFDYRGMATFQSYPSNTLGATTGINTVYDALGRMSSQTTTDNITLAQIAYLSQNRMQTTDADNKTTVTSFQAFDTPSYDKALVITAPEGQTTTIGRDLFGMTHTVTQSGLYNGSTLSVTRNTDYDAYYRPCRQFDPEAGNTLWGYDAAGQTTWEAKGQASTACTTTAPAGATLFSYDLRGRKTLDDYPGTADDVTYGFDAAGNLTSVVNPTASWTYGYNKRNLLESELGQIDGRNYPIDPAYNSLAQLSNLTYPDTLSIAYSPNAFGEPTQLTASCCSGAALGSYASTIQYYANGLIQSYNLGNGLSYSQGLDNLQRLNLQSTKSGATPIQQLAYAYSNGGDLTSITDQVNGTDNATLTYDNLHRLKTAAGIWGNSTYGYDPLNNLVSRTGSSTLNYGYDPGTNRLNAVTGSVTRSYSYNPNGATTGDGLRSFTLNGRDQITSIPGVATYSYDGNGKRIKTVKADGTVEYAMYSVTGTLLYTDNPVADHTDYIQLGGKIVVQVDGGNPTYLHPDLLGSPRMATNSGGGILWNEHFDPYGQKLNGVNEKIGYTGHAYDAETQLTYAQARFYDPAVGRFLSNDPVGFNDGPFSFNRYIYVNNNPYGGTDPTGEQGFSSFSFGLAPEEIIPLEVAKPAEIVDTIKPAENLRESPTAGDGKKIPNPYGKSGGPDHQETIRTQEKLMQDKKLVTEREYPIKTPAGEKGKRFVDLVGKNPETGDIEDMVQVGKQNKDGTMVSRERRAGNDIDKATADLNKLLGKDIPPVRYVPYNKP